ncbi:MAG: ferrochelatase [Deferribacterota bacterium]|nr:ferrochelatase [Deferribacterota bacterium]
MNNDLLILFYIGAPKDTIELKEFILNIFSDRDVVNLKIPLFLQKLLANIIASIKIRKSAKIYNNYFNGASPQIEILNSFTEKIKMKYQLYYKRELDIKLAMCYTEPYIEKVISSLYKKSYNKIYITTLYPHYSYTTVGVCFKRFFNSTFYNPVDNNYTIKNFWFFEPKYNKLLCDRIVESCKKLNVSLNDTTLVFTAHSLPLSTKLKGDPYTDHLQEHINIILKQLKPLSPKNYYLSFQSKASFGKWLKPSTIEIINKLINEGVNNIIFIPITFINDHIETIYEIDNLYIKKLNDYNINAIRIDSLNDDDRFVEAFIDMLD